jgi:Fic family protein
MGEDLLRRIEREIRERKEQSRAAYEEAQRLESALAALGSGADNGKTPSAPGRRQRRAGHRSTAGKRARRGQNLAKIRDAVRERPGVSAGEVAQATGIAKPTVASTLGKLVKGGELERTELPGGGVGFRAAHEVAGARPADDASKSAADGV